MSIDIEMRLIRQTFKIQELDNIEEKIQEEIKKINICQKIKPGMKIGITAGSRGINRIHEVISIISNEVKKYGGSPIVIASMGSHGGATKQGQLEILRHYGIIEENIGAPIIATDKSFVIGYLKNGLPVYVNDLVKSLDGILVVNRIKVHTSFKAPIESGLSKMTAIGLGHHKGASLIHSLGIENLHRNIIRFSNRILKELPIIGGIGLLENSYDQILEISAANPENFQDIDRELLIKSKKVLPRLPVNNIDLLIIKEIGKNISGTGMDSNIVGGIPMVANKGGDNLIIPQIKEILVFDLSAESNGNAHGIGWATAITKKLYNKIDFKSTYINSITSGFLWKSRIPMVFPTEKDAITTCLKVLGDFRKQELRIVIIKNTLDLEKMFVSKIVWKNLQNNKNVFSEDYNYRLNFNKKGKLELNL